MLKDTTAQGHGDDAQGHDDDAQGHGDDVQGHGDDAQGHDDDAQGHGDDAQEHGDDDAQGHDDDAQGHGDDAQGHEYETVILDVCGEDTQLNNDVAYSCVKIICYQIHINKNYPLIIINKHQCVQVIKVLIMIHNPSALQVWLKSISYFPFKLGILSDYYYDLPCMDT